MRWPSPRCGRTRSGKPATASTAPGSPTRASCRSPSRSSTECSATGRTRRSASATTSRSTPRQLTDLTVPGGQITEAGVRANVSVALQYLNAWLQGTGAAAINNLMEDAATAEISRAQLWQWIHNGATHRGRRADHQRALRPDPRRGAGQARRRRERPLPRRGRDPRRAGAGRGVRAVPHDPRLCLPRLIAVGHRHASRVAA